MSYRPQALIPILGKFRLSLSALALAGLAFVLFGCFSGGLVTKDFSEFETYEFKQTTGLGFCADMGRAFSVKITRQDDGTFDFAHSVLKQVSNNPDQCEDGVANDQGCFRPQPKASRTLSSAEVDQVKAVFGDVKYYRGPDKICREIAVDPCMIERHSWDSTALNDYICGADRIVDDQRQILRNLLVGLEK